MVNTLIAVLFASLLAWIALPSQYLLIFLLSWQISKDPNNYSDTETRCLVYVGLVASNGNGRLFHCCCEANNSLISAPHIFTHTTNTPETSGHVVNSALTITHRTIGGVCQPDFAIVWQSGRGGMLGNLYGGVSVAIHLLSIDKADWHTTSTTGCKTLKNLNVTKTVVSGLYELCAKSVKCDDAVALKNDLSRQMGLQPNLILTTEPDFGFGLKQQRSFFVIFIFICISIIIIGEPLSQPFGGRDYGREDAPRRIHYNLISLLLRDNIIARG